MTDHPESQIDAKINAQLRDRCCPTDANELIARVALAAGRHHARRQAFIAASVALLMGAGGAGWFTYALMRPVAAPTPAAAPGPEPVAPAAAPGPHDAQAARRFAETYANALARGFDTGACCAGPVSLKTVCATTYMAPLDLDPKAAVVLCGSYRGESLGGCTGFLARVNGEPILVFVCPREQDPRPDPSEFADLRLHRREIGAFVVYELSPSPFAQVIPHLFSP